MREIDFSRIYHQESKRHQGLSLDSSTWPEEWKTIYYKTYPRLPKIDLIDEDSLEKFLNTEAVKNNIFEFLKDRCSERKFSDEGITKKELSVLLKFSCGLSGKKTLQRDKSGKSIGYLKHRVYPSAGARYPIELYPLIIKNNTDIRPGLYHYDVKNNRLDILWNKKFKENELKNLISYNFAQKSALLIFLTAVFWRTQNKYGQRGYRYILLEAGHIGQNLDLMAGALNLKRLALAGTYDEKIEELLDINGVDESLIYTYVFGK